MNRQDQHNLLEKLHSELADIERQQQDLTLPHSDQQLLDQAWEDVTNKIDELEEILRVAEEYEEVEWRDAAEYLESESEDSRPPTPRPTEPLRFAPPPPSITLESGINSRGEIVARVPGGPWRPVGVPMLSETRRPPPIEIPSYTGPTGCPPPPRPGGVSICNCDGDGMCAYCEEEQLQQWNSAEDDRVGCRYCSGCMYCQDSRYDGADEI
jgi:hypothetical protein